DHDGISSFCRCNCGTGVSNYPENAGTDVYHHWFFANVCRADPYPNLFFDWRTSDSPSPLAICLTGYIGAWRQPHLSTTALIDSRSCSAAMLVQPATWLTRRLL